MLKEKDYLLIVKVRNTRVNGTTMLLKGMECTLTAIKQSTKVSGLQICKTEKELRNGQMDPYSWASTRMERKMDWANISGQTGLVMRENGLTMIFLVMVTINGQMVGSSLVSGVTTS